MSQLWTTEDCEFLHALHVAAPIEWREAPSPYDVSVEATVPEEDYRELERTNWQQKRTLKQRMEQIKIERDRALKAEALAELAETRCKDWERKYVATSWMLMVLSATLVIFVGLPLLWRVVVAVWGWAF